MSEYVKRVDSEQIRKQLTERGNQNMILLDIRQDWEYEEEHLPGALHIPLPELTQRLDELPLHRPIVVYCRSGARSAAAATLLKAQDFEDVSNMTGGMNSWLGISAVGPSSAGLAVFTPDATEAEIITVACRMEEQLSRFYSQLAKENTDAELVGTLTRLASFEQKHKSWLLITYRQLMGHELDLNLLTESIPPTEALEGGLTAEEFIEYNRPALSDSLSIIETGMMFETQALDLYLRCSKRPPRQESKMLFYKLAEEEKRHLKALATLMDKMQHS
ncbi:rhodanese-like domain-containing protein [Desulfobaculum bizertense]|uniref:Rhodanese-related sulfurtransferase n=1 Tax=Desulfobaculum bizertense DSM 18034 TaxID=1121442 RepID=A0A1T4W7E4_9BACT|nr:rhodanese-like domain-containing protein [Desulfobaculum bizertense]SKA72958.1 Rhodanese-related sulfurtransferase [Desulfobaculum bizertense DSM 18034]